MFEIAHNYIVIFLKVNKKRKHARKITQLFLPASMKSMNPMQKYPDITESFASTRKILGFMFSFSTSSVISSGTCSTPKLSKQAISPLLQNNAIQCVPTAAYSSRFIT